MVRSRPYRTCKALPHCATLNATGAGKITHVVYIVQENRSFDNLFQGYPGADTVSSGKDSHGKTITLQPFTLGRAYDIDHSAQAMFAACNGTGKLPGTKCRMNGFNKEGDWGGPVNPEYVFVPHRESKPYFDMAHEWVLADRMFQSQLDESFVAHQYIIAAQADWSVDLPAGQWGCGASRYDKVSTITVDRNPDGRKIKPCYDYQTLGDELDKAKLSWRFYAATYGSASSDAGAEWSGYMAVRHIRYGPDWKKDVISPNWKFITDVRAGKLANFTWITPVCDDSDHVNCPGGYGPSWVSALVNTVGKSKFWDSTVIFVQWDDWGGLYDHVPPPYNRTVWVSRSAAGYLTVRQTKLRFARAVRNRERTAFCRRSVRPRSTRAGRQTRDITCGRLSRLLTEATAVRKNRRAAAAEVLHAPV